MVAEEINKKTLWRHLLQRAKLLLESDRSKKYGSKYGGTLVEDIEKQSAGVTWIAAVSFSFSEGGTLTSESKSNFENSIP